MINYISGEKLQEIAELTIIFEDQRFGDLWPVQIKNTNCKYVIIKRGDPIPNDVHNARSIFVYTHGVDMFTERVLPSLNHKFTLMSHNSDWGVDEKYRSLLDDDRIVEWYAQNIAFIHPKLKPIPIGIANSQWPHGNFKNIQEVINCNNSKTELVYNNFNCNTSPGNRVHVQQALNKNNIPTNLPVNNATYLQELSRSKFCICPYGSGYDSHRVWEALYLGSIPVVPNGPVFNYKNLPFLKVDNWNTVNVNLLEDAYDKIINNDYDLNELNIDYWRAEIENTYI